MGLSRLLGFLRRHRAIALDTSVFIYQLEANTRYLPLTNHIFSWLERPGSRAVTSTITMTEVLVQPYRESDIQRVDEFYALLSTYPNLHWIAPDLGIADVAARIRALYRLRTPDVSRRLRPNVSARAVSSPMTLFLNEYQVLRHWFSTACCIDWISGEPSVGLR